MNKSPYASENKMLAAALKELRLDRNATQVQVALSANIRQTDISKVENGVRQVSYLEIRRWLSALNCNLAAFDEELEKRLQMLRALENVQTERK